MRGFFYGCPGYYGRLSCREYFGSYGTLVRETRPAAVTAAQSSEELGEVCR